MRNLLLMLTCLMVVPLAAHAQSDEDVIRGMTVMAVANLLDISNSVLFEYADVRTRQRVAGQNRMEVRFPVRGASACRVAAAQTVVAFSQVEVPRMNVTIRCTGHTIEMTLRQGGTMRLVQRRGRSGAVVYRYP